MTKSHRATYSGGGSLIRDLGQIHAALEKRGRGQETKSRRGSYGGGGLPIRDPALLARVFAALEKREGGQSAAAERLGITAVWFWQLRHAKVRKGGISRGLFDRISWALEDDRRLLGQLVRAVASTETRPQRKAYWTWLRRQWRSLCPRDAEEVTDTRWWRLYAELYAALPGPAKRRVQAYRRRWGYAHGIRRELLALADVIRPFLASDESGGVERSWRELARGRELVSYLSAALRAQDILLDREGDLFRRSEQVARAAGRPVM